MNKLSSLSLRTAEIESIYIIRDLAHRASLPLSEPFLDQEFSPFFVSDTDKELMKSSEALIDSTIQDIIKLGDIKGNIYELINLQRTINTLKESHRPLIQNLKFAGDLQIWQQACLSEISHILNSIPDLKAQEDRIHFNQRLNEVFQTILRNSEFAFNSKDIINEMHIEHMAALKESLAKGFLFHVTLEEELKKEDFSEIRSRIPSEAIQAVENLTKNIEEIKRGVDRAYDLNLRMVNWALLLYCYVKMLNKK